MPELAIASIEAIAMPIPLAKPIASALGSYTHVDCVTVLMHIKDGPTGFGFNLGLGGAASAAIVPYIEQELARWRLGRMPWLPKPCGNECGPPTKPG